ncbi:MAG: pirin family protein [Bacteroidales bacterium]|jgi:redox-sensitive bicupin YhaK (pirin superfamily)|nr:pirin family protein [Bacteroidales bacterium]
MTDSILHSIKPLGFYWDTADPFIFCVHHNDFYPAGNENMGPDPSLLRGRNIGSDFTVREGWRMYHGDRVPGFPVHPHRGFETVTLVRNGFVDHSDSIGAAGRYGNGDVQWMTAGAGIQHCEMFPLLDRDGGNHLELFQIWINLPARNKMVQPHFSMLWGETIPEVVHSDNSGRKTTIRIIAGSLDGAVAPGPAPDSWAADPGNETAIWTIRLEPHARWIIPPASAQANRTLYFFRGKSLTVADNPISSGLSFRTRCDIPVELTNGDSEGEILLLQSKPIGEPVIQHGPFVMNTEAEIRQAFIDYRATAFGGWPWSAYDNVHARDAGRFALHADGRKETKNQ